MEKDHLLCVTIKEHTKINKVHKFMTTNNTGDTDQEDKRGCQKDRDPETH